MAAIKVHGSIVSPNVWRVMACLYEKQLDFQFIPVDMSTGQHKKQPYLSLNPFGQVPAVEHGDLKLFESRAITQYIAHEYAKRGTQLVSHESNKMATLLVWMSVEAHQFDPPASKLTWELVVKPMFGMTTDDAIVEENEAKLAGVLDIYETRLAESKYIGGDCFTLADLNHIPNIYILMSTRSKKLFESRPHVAAWVADIVARPAWLKVLAMQKQQ